MCKYCEKIPKYPKMNILDGDLGISIFDGIPSICSETINLLVHTTNHIAINFCPICGKKLVPEGLQSNIEGLVIYTDGAFRPSVGQGGWAYVAVQNNKIVYEDYDGKSNVTNNIMELYAVLRALVYVLTTKCSEVTICTDSQYVFGCATKGWKRNKNTKLWEYFDKYMAKISDNSQKVSIEWVKGHADNKFNNRADELAVRGSKLVL